MVLCKMKKRKKEAGFFRESLDFLPGIYYCIVSKKIRHKQGIEV